MPNRTRYSFHCKIRVLLFLLLVPRLYLWDSPFWVRFLLMLRYFLIQPWGSHIPSSWMVHTECVFVAGIYFWVRAMKCMCVQTRLRFILSYERVLGNGVRNHVNSKGKSPLPNLLRGGSTPRLCIKQDSEPNTTNELFRPHFCLW